MATPTYSITRTTPTSITLYINTVSTYSYYKVYLSTLDDSTVVINDRVDQRAEFPYVIIENLQPGTSYKMNVYYGTSESNATTIGRQDRTTPYSYFSTNVSNIQPTSAKLNINSYNEYAYYRVYVRTNYSTSDPAVDADWNYPQIYTSSQLANGLNMTGLTPNTPYAYNIFCGETTNTLKAYYGTPQTFQTTSIYVTSSITNRTSTSITFSISGNSACPYYKVEIIGNTTATNNNVSHYFFSGSGTITIGNLTPNTSYTYNIHYSTDNSTWSKVYNYDQSFLTSSLNTSFSISSTGKGNIQLQILADSGYPSYRIFIKKDLGNNTYEEYQHIDKSLSSGYHTIDITQVTKLNGEIELIQPNTTYVINVGYRFEDTNGVVKWMGAQTATTKSIYIDFQPYSVGVDTIVIRVTADNFYPWYIIPCHTKEEEDTDAKRVQILTTYENITLTGLMPGTEYIIGLGYSKTDGGYKYLDKILKITTDTINASYTIDEIGKDDISVTVNGSTKCEYYNVYIRVDDGTTNNYVKDWGPKTFKLSETEGANNGIFSFTTENALKPNTKYVINVYYSNVEGGGYPIGAKPFQTLAVYYIVLNFNANGGSGAPSKIEANEITEYIEVTIPKETPTRNKYLFSSWNTAKDGSGDNYAPGETFVGQGSTDSSGKTYTLYAQWIEEGSGGQVKIYDGITWVNATAYIYDGVNWLAATPYIYDGQAWVTII